MVVTLLCSYTENIIENLNTGTWDVQDIDNRQGFLAGSSKRSLSITVLRFNQVPVFIFYFCCFENSICFFKCLIIVVHAAPNCSMPRGGGGGGGGGHSGTEGGRTFVTYFAEEGVFF